MYQGTKSEAFCYGTIMVPPPLHIVKTAIEENAGEDQEGIVAVPARETK